MKLNMFNTHATKKELKWFKTSLKIITFGTLIENAEL